MLYVIRLLLLGAWFVVAGALNVLVVLLRPFNPDNSRICAAIYAYPALRLMGLRVIHEVETLRAQPRPFVVLANHQSNHDLFVMGSVVPRRTVSIGKKSLKWVPIFGQVYWLSGNVMIDRGNARKAKEAMLATTDTLLNKDTSIWVFPEGTRNHGKGLLPLKKGAFHTAIAAGVPIMMVCSSSYLRHMNLNRWHGGDIIIRSLPPIETKGMTNDDVPALMARCEQAMKACIAELDQRVESGQL